MAQRRVVVAQDEPKLLDVMTEGLARAGFETVTATNGEQALHILEEGDHDAAILDISLPIISGFRLVKLLRRHPTLRQVPLIVTTSYFFEEIEELADEGVEAFIMRPFEQEDLVTRLEYALAGSQHHRHNLDISASAIA